MNRSLLLRFLPIVAMAAVTKVGVTIDMSLRIAIALLALYVALIGFAIWAWIPRKHNDQR